MIYLLIVLGLALAYLTAVRLFARSNPRPRLPEGEPSPLPEDLLYGTATAAHQIEGGNTRSDWARFEAEGKVARGEKSGLASDHWRRVAEDISLMKELGANAYRFSLEWSRLEPEEGRYDEAAWERYTEELSQLRDQGITPMVTLLHFTLPAWLADRGGLTSPEFPRLFGRFAAEATRRLWSMVELWCTVNEPNVQVLLGYLQGIWPPEKKSPAEAGRAFAGLLRGHAEAAREIRALAPEAQIGAALNLVAFEPESRASLPDWLITRAAARAFNWAFYDAIERGHIKLGLPGLPLVDEPCEELIGSVDFLGVNYYSRYRLGFSPFGQGMARVSHGPGEKSDLGWEIYPEGLLQVLRAGYRRYRLPIYITENGIADAPGEKRGRFLREHLRALSAALDEGIPVRGYFHWSLIDNFEWHEGFAPRFGLYRVDYETQTRSPAPGADVFRELAPARPRFE